MSQIIISYIDRRPLPMIFIEISPKRVKVGANFIFCHLVDVMAQWYTSNVESSLNNLRLFVSIPSNSNRIIWSFILKKKQEYCFLVCAGLLENLVKLLWWKIGLRRGRKQYQSILNINHSEVKVKIKYVFTFYFMSFWAVQRELQHIEFLHFW